MNENMYILEILNGSGIAMNEKNHSEILIYFPLFFDEKKSKFILDTKYKITTEYIGTVLSDFLNTDLENTDDFYSFFIKYYFFFNSYEQIKKYLDKTDYSSNSLKELSLKILQKNKSKLNKLRNQTNKILDYCLLNPNPKYIKYKPIERLSALRRLFPELTILNDHKTQSFNIDMFSSYPGDTEKEFYNFLSKNTNKVKNINLILPENLNSVIYFSLVNVLNEKIKLKKCANCNKYFICYGTTAIYCSNVAPGETIKRCKDIGRKNTFQNNLKNDPVLKKYYRKYNQKSTRASRNSDIISYVEDFENFKIKGLKYKNNYINGKISAEKFNAWIDSN